MTTCGHCHEILLDSERHHMMAAFHHECAVRLVAGSLGHIQKKCTCYRTELAGPAPEDDPPNMTVREAALAAYLEFNRTRNVGTA
ncbi:MAG: hypothetical protein EPN91_00240 [Salinibacterium sp.]|nr:MAG: hypothetical protein EPN91_00240 [Salinibacterium sp.]